MASSGSSVSVPREVVDDLLGLRESGAMLQTMFEGSSTLPSAAAGRELLDGMMTRVTSALSTLNTSVVGGGASSSSVGRRRNRAGSAVAGPHRRRSSSSSRRRTLSPFLETVTTGKLDDGHAWRKYGQKHIQDSENPRSYYRCTHMPDQGCKARKQVQVSDTNPSEYIVSYFGQHTCRDPSEVPILIESAATDAPTNFISFGGSAAATTSAAHHAAVPPHNHRQLAVPRPMMPSRFAGGYYSSSLPAAAQDRCGSEEAISSFSAAGELGAVVMGSSSSTRRIAVGSAPEYDVLTGGGIDTGSLPSSPSSLGGFMTTAGSFGSFGGDDDLFGFDL